MAGVALSVLVNVSDRLSEAEPGVNVPTSEKVYVLPDAVLVFSSAPFFSASVAPCNSEGSVTTTSYFAATSLSLETEKL